MQQRTSQEIQMTVDVQTMVMEAIRSVDPAIAIKRCLKVDVQNATQPKIKVIDRRKIANDTTNDVISKVYDLFMYENIIVVGIGKAASAMVSSVLETIVPAISKIDHSNQSPNMPPNVSGIVLTKFGHITDQQRTFLEANGIVVREASHPIPCEVGVSASYELLHMISDTSNTHNNKLVIACISGGGSALFCTPQHPLTLDDLKATNNALLQTGWPITSMNLVRTALEYGKGGGMAEAVLKQSLSNGTSVTNLEIVSFILSDVVGDPIDIIASGPTVIRSRTMKQFAMQKAYEMVRDSDPSQIKFPKAVVDFLSMESENMSTASHNDTSKTDELSNQCLNCLVGTNAVAVEAAALRATELGYHPIVLGTKLQGEASTVAQVLVGLAQNIQQPSTSYSINEEGTYPIALIAGGETTVTLPSDSIDSRLGGRNQELALSAALALHDHQIRQVVVASIGTDGNDGPTDAAGAIVDGGTVYRMDSITESTIPTASSSNFKAKFALQSHNSYSYFNRTDSYGHSPLLKVGTSN
jgi:glycerate 2-kinase